MHPPPARQKELNVSPTRPYDSQPPTLYAYAETSIDRGLHWHDCFGPNDPIVASYNLSPRGSQRSTPPAIDRVICKKDLHGKVPKDWVRNPSSVFPRILAGTLQLSSLPPPPPPSPFLPPLSRTALSRLHPAQ